MHEHIHVRGHDFKQARRKHKFPATRFRTQLHPISCGATGHEWDLDSGDEKVAGEQ